VNGTTTIMRDGASAGLSSLKSGDPVMVHVIPSGNSTVAERILAGTFTRQGGRGGFGGGPPGAPSQPATGPTATT
jgi:hypothetical protein